MAEKRPSVAVVGGGWAGLSAAIELVDAGCATTVFESARRLGGRARAVDWQTQTVDNGQHILIGAYRETLAALVKVGVDPALALRRLPLTVDVPGRLALRLRELPAPLHLVLGLLFAKGPLWREKLGAARFIQALQRTGFRLASDCSVTHWLDAHAQHGTLRDHLWNPLCIAALNTRPEDASAQVFANVLRDTLGGDRAATDLLLPNVDLSALFPEPAGKYVAGKGGAIRCSTRVRTIAAEDGRWRVSTSDENLLVDHVILACAPQHAAALLTAVAPSPALAALLAKLSAFAFEPIATAYLQYTTALPQTTPMVALNDGLAQWVFDRGQLGGTAGLYAHVLSARGDWQQLSSENLVAALDASHRIALGANGRPPVDWKVICEQKATFRCSPAIDRPGFASGAPNLWLAGDYVACDYPGTLEAAVRSGGRAAAAVLGRDVAKIN